MRRPGARLVGALALAGAGLLLAACGVPLSNAAQPLPKTGAERELLDKPPSSGTTSTTNAPASAVSIDVYFFDATFSRLVQTTAQEPPPATATEALGLLAYGPTAQDSHAGLQTALSTLPQATPSVKVNKVTGLATVALDSTTYLLYGPPAAEAFAQIVYTVTSPTLVDHVSGVVFTFAGSPTGAYLPNGSFTSKPVTRTDYSAYAPLGHTSTTTGTTMASGHFHRGG